MGAVAIREAIPDDHATITDILRVGYAGFEPDTPYLRGVLDPSRWADLASATLVAEDGLGVVGVVAFALADSPLHEPVVPPIGDASFRFLSVAERARGRGVGGSLVEACVDRARRAGCRRLAIFSMAFMGDAHRLYERLGFRRRPDLDVRFPGGEGLALTHDLADDAEAVFGGPGPVPARPPWYGDVFDDAAGIDPDPDPDPDRPHDPDPDPGA